MFKIKKGEEITASFGAFKPCCVNVENCSYVKTLTQEQKAGHGV
jgi:hypothetical protein